MIPLESVICDDSHYVKSRQAVPVFDFPTIDLPTSDLPTSDNLQATRATVEGLAGLPHLKQLVIHLYRAGPGPFTLVEFSALRGLCDLYLSFLCDENRCVQSKGNVAGMHHHNAVKASILFKSP